jgi:hypothetical protein
MCDGEKVRHAWIYGGMCEIRPPVYKAGSVYDLGRSEVSTVPEEDVENDREGPHVGD